MSELMRLDAALVALGLAGGRDKAKGVIADGQVTVNGVVVRKASTKVSLQDEIACAVRERFVGRGGEKLLKVLEQTGLSVDGCCCVDIGASTGGFTDCLLQHGARKVFAVDVGHGQLADCLRADARVACMEGTDIRDRDAIATYISDGTVDLCTIDVSFISLTAVWESLVPLLKPDGCVVCLIKPQFEAGRAALSKRGVVTHEKDHLRVLQTLQRFWQERRWSMIYLSCSPILGGEGNIEYVALLKAEGEAPLLSLDTVVREAFDSLKRRATL